MTLHVCIPLFFTSMSCIAAVHLFSLLCGIPLLDHITVFFSLVNKHLHSVQVFALTYYAVRKILLQVCRQIYQILCQKWKLLVVRYAHFQLIRVPTSFPKHLCQFILPPTEYIYFLCSSSQAIFLCFTICWV